MSQILGTLISIITTCFAGYHLLQLIGGRQALRNRWVKVPLIISALGVIAFAAEAFRVDFVHAGRLAARGAGMTALIMGTGFTAFAAGMTVALVSGMRHRRRAELTSGEDTGIDALRTDVRNLISAQMGYFHEHRRYAENLAELSVQYPVTLLGGGAAVEGNHDGFVVSAWDDALPPGASRCTAATGSLAEARGVREGQLVTT